MSDKTPITGPQSDGMASWFPTAYTILFALIVIVAALAWIIPAGQYDRAMNDEVGREIAVPGTYQAVDPNPKGFVEVMLAPVAGFYDPDSLCADMSKSLAAR